MQKQHCVLFSAVIATVEKIRVTLAYKGNANTCFVDNISLMGLHIPILCSILIRRESCLPSSELHGGIRDQRLAAV